MKSKLITAIQGWWPVLAFVATALTFGGMWYNRTCQLEDHVQNLSRDVSTLKVRTATIETVTQQTRDDVRFIQDLLIQRSLTPLVDR